jgi:hypothetical protein
MLAFISPAMLNALLSTQCFVQPGATRLSQVNRDELLRTNYHDTRLASSGASCSMAQIGLVATHTSLRRSMEDRQFQFETTPVRRKLPMFDRRQVHTSVFLPW